MEDQTTNLLNATQLKMNHWALDEYKRQFDHYEAQWLLIGKYHKKLWFQKSMRKSEAELLIEYKRLAGLIYDLEVQINDCRLKLHQHHAAVEHLHNCMKPFDKVDLSTTALVQTALF